MCIHVYVYSLNLEFGESLVVFFKKSKFKYNWHNVKNSYHSLLFTNAVSSGGVSSFFEELL